MASRTISDRRSRCTRIPSECSTHSLDAFTDAHKGHDAQQAQSVMEWVSAGGIAAGSQSASNRIAVKNQSRR